MKVFTSYFANIKNIPEDFFLVSVSGGQSNGLQEQINFFAPKLRPSKDIFFEYKATKDWKTYVDRFKSEILVNVDWLEQLETFESHANKISKTVENIVLLCYESADTEDGLGNFCHRHILAESIEEEFVTNVLEYGFENYERNNYRMVQPFSADFLF